MKVYPTVGTIPTAIQAMDRLIQEHKVGADQIEAIDVWLQPHALLHGAAITHPTDVVGAQFSLAFSLALCAVRRRNDLADYMDAAAWADERIRDVARRVAAHGDDRYGSTGKTQDWKTTYGARVRVTLRDGSAHEAEELYRKGSPANPLEPGELEAKFRQLATPSLSPAQATAVIEAVAGLDELDDVGNLARAVSVTGG